MTTDYILARIYILLILYAESLQIYDAARVGLGGGNKEKGSDLGSKYEPRCDSIKYDVQDRRFAYQFGRFLVQTKDGSSLQSFIG